MTTASKEMTINCPSYKRPSDVKVLRYLPRTNIYVDCGEAEEYRKNYPNASIVSVPKGIQGNLSRIRNYILDDNKDSICVMVDDDLKYIGYFEGGERRKLENEDQVMAFFFKYSTMAIDLGCHLWGMNVNTNKQCYREYSPFSTVSYIGDPVTVHIEDDIRYDERFRLKMDYDFALQHLNKYRKILRINKFHYSVSQMEQVGGCSEYRNIDEERREMGLLKDKWGSKIVKEEDIDMSRNHMIKKKRRFDVNPFIKVPIRGI